MAIDLEALLQERRDARAETERAIFQEKYNRNNANINRAFTAEQREALGIFSDDIGSYFDYRGMQFTLQARTDGTGEPYWLLGWSLRGKESSHRFHDETLWEGILYTLSTIV